tara:strand:- start:621 stop:824 length:204 start_codon:yes stop_codon:yes gene_type:complete
MKVKILEKCYTGIVGNMHKGEEHEMDDGIAEKLIARGYAEPVKEKKTSKKLSDRKVKAEDISTPEGE